MHVLPFLEFGEKHKFASFSTIFPFWIISLKIVTLTYIIHYVKLKSLKFISGNINFVKKSLVQLLKFTAFARNLDVYFTIAQLSDSKSPVENWPE